MLRDRVRFEGAKAFSRIDDAVQHIKCIRDFMVRELKKASHSLSFQELHSVLRIATTMAQDEFEAWHKEQMAEEEDDHGRRGSGPRISKEGDTDA